MTRHRDHGQEERSPIDRLWSLVLTAALSGVAATAAAGTPVKTIIGNDDPSLGSSGHPRVRFVNLAPDAGSVDVIVGGSASFTNVGHGRITEFAGTPTVYQVSAVPAGTTGPILASTQVTYFPSHEDVTVIPGANGHLAWYPENLGVLARPEDAAMVRVYIDVAELDMAHVECVGRPLLASYAGSGEWDSQIEVSAGTCDLRVLRPEGGLIVARDATFAPGGMYTVYVGEALPEHAYLIPGVARAHGVGGAYWVSDLTVFNPGTETAQVELSFKGSATPSPIQRTIASRQQLTIPDVLATGFGIAGEDVGVVTVSSAARLDTHVRTYSLGVDPKTGEVTTFGQSYPGLERAQALPGSRLGYLTGLRSDGAYRSNLELVNAGDEDATVEVRFLDAGGGPIGGELSREVAPGRRVGITAALPPGHPSAYAEIRLSPPEARVIAFGSVIDGTSNDPTTVPLTPGPAAETAICPLEGSWEGQVKLAQLNIANSNPVEPAAGCVADYLRSLLGGGGPAGLSIRGASLVPDSMPAAFGTCTAGSYIPEEEGIGPYWSFTCHFGLPRTIGCGGTTHGLTLRQDTGPGRLVFSADLSTDGRQLRFEVSQDFIATPTEASSPQGLRAWWNFELERAR